MDVGRRQRHFPGSNDGFAVGFSTAELKYKREQNKTKNKEGLSEICILWFFYTNLLHLVALGLMGDGCHEINLEFPCYPKYLHTLFIDAQAFPW